ncbi:hypothetical protein RN04_14565 [Arthrobacter sp. W1]|nr:hypothetical protein RN04_14565 [Arthrobacter sp. W1]
MPGSKNYLVIEFCTVHGTDLPMRSLSRHSVDYARTMGNWQGPVFCKPFELLTQVFPNQRAGRERSIS